MCGIVGAVAERDVLPILVEGLRRLEYRGYDSAGVAVINGGASIGRVRVSARSRAGPKPRGESPPRWPRDRPHPLGHPRGAERG